MDSIVDSLKRLGIQRLIAMIAVTAILLTFFIYIAMRVTQPALSTLFTDLSTTDTNAITRDLEAKGVKYELRQDGATVLVPKDQVLKLRLDLASKGLPAGGGIGYEIFDKGDNFSSTSFVQNVNHLRALEGELVRTIRSLDRVQSARVHLVLPERKLFSREQQEPRASIVLKVRGELDAGQIRAIRHLTASAVEGLKPERISIVDEAGRLLADGAGNEADAGAIAADKQNSFEKRMRTEIEDIIASVVGRGRARVQVSANIDFNRVQQTSETFDPESRVVRSTQTRNEAQATTEAKDGSVSVSNELPAAQQNQNNPNAPATKETTQKSEETINYEMSRVTRTETIEGGRLKKLSVAVLVDGTYAKGNDGEFGYQPRSQEELDRIQTLVRTAMGFDKGRGDQLEVVNLRFAEAPTQDAGKELSFLEKLFSFSKDDTLRLAELGVFAVTTLLVLFLAVRPLLKQVVAPDVFRKAIPGFMNGGDGEGGVAQIETKPEMIEFSQLNGALKATTVDQVGQIVANNPQETIAVLRNWIHGGT